ncbi:MAG: ComEA family DNA-binding protein [Planctomycetota bacterium]|jgi:competence ComEA-like helix-hairpin-helix protein
MTADNFTHSTANEQDKTQSFAFVISAIVCILFCVIFASSDFARPRHSVRIDLESRVNPNAASLASLIRLPGIGIGRAEAIIVYRKKYSESRQDNRAFENSNDLQEVKGIGPKTVQDIDEWLQFE